jgi:hypothetical protein
LLLIGFFVVALFRRRRGGTEPWMALVAGTFACGYAFFWGTYGTSLKGSLTAFLGPFYFLPVLACVTLLAAKGFDPLWRRDRLMALSALAGMVLVSGYLLTAALRVNLRLTAEDGRLYGPVAAADLDRALVFLPPMWGPHLLHPFAWLQNGAGYDGETVYALDRGEPADLALLDDYPGRVAYRLHVHGAYRTSPPDPGLTTSLEPLVVLEQPSLDTDLTLANPAVDAPVRVSVALNGREHTFVLDTSAQAGNAYQARIRISADAVELEGAYTQRQIAAVEPDGFISLSISVGTEDGGPARTLYKRQLACTVEGSAVRVLMPGVVTVNELGAEPWTLTSAQPPKRP